MRYQVAIRYGILRNVENAFTQVSDLRKGDKVIIRSSRGVEFGEALSQPEELDGKAIVSDMGEVLHKITAEEEKKQKGFDMLIEVFSRLRRSGHNWKLIIIGGGPLEKELRRQAKELGIEEVVCFTGHVSNPLNILPKCDLFVLSSRFEGFSNALLEAMACGLPVVSFDCHYSPRELIQHGVNGLLVQEGDLVVLESTLSQLMQDGKMRAELGNEAKKVNQKYAPEKIMKEWEELMNVSSNKI
jgi:glycosyltransferase involved in cell wall biosynthesis